MMQTKRESRDREEREREMHDECGEQRSRERGASLPLLTNRFQGKDCPLPMFLLRARLFLIFAGREQRRIRHQQRVRQVAPSASKRGQGSEGNGRYLSPLLERVLSFSPALSLANGALVNGVRSECGRRTDG